MLSELQKKDLSYNWHPYTQHFNNSPPIVIEKGKDALLWDENGKEYIDAIGSWWANPHGHANQKIADAISEQIHTLEHVLFGGFTHPSAIKLSENLLKHLPGFDKVFYSDNGSTAIEVALKMALQFYHNQNQSKNVCIAFENAFHGDTFGAMSVSGISLFSTSYKDLTLPVERIPLPDQKNWETVKNKFIQLVDNKDVYAFIFEPLVQGASGMKMYDSTYLDDLISIAKAHQVLCIADEVMTGFGRTGKLFAIDYLQEKPDIICLSKALTGGFIPLSTTITTEHVFNAFYHEDRDKALFHGHTFMANPAGCAAALASLEISVSKETQSNIQRIQQKYSQFRQELESFPFVKNIRNMGVIFAFDIENKGNNDYYGPLRDKMYQHFIDHYIIARPVGNTIYFLPAYCITDQQLDKILECTLELLHNLDHENF